MKTRVMLLNRFAGSQSFFCFSRPVLLNPTWLLTWFAGCLLLKAPFLLAEVEVPRAHGEERWFIKKKVSIIQCSS